MNTRMENIEVVEVVEEVKVAPKFNVGDKVYYIDIDGMEKVGTIKNIEWTEISAWNNESNPLYLVTSSDFLRNEEDILEIYW